MCFTGFRYLAFDDLKDIESLSSEDNDIEEYSFGLGESVGHMREGSRGHHSFLYLSFLALLCCQ
jgi:hypothetical protein